MAYDEMSCDTECLRTIVVPVETYQALLAAVIYADTRAVSRGAAPYACMEDRRLRSLIDAALAKLDDRAIPELGS
jgi:hypothetical protein